MKNVFLVFGILFLMFGAACQTQTATPIALVATILPPPIATASPTSTLTRTQTPTIRATATKTLRPRLQTQTAVKTITPDTATPTPTRPPTNTPLPTPLVHEWDTSIKEILPAPLYLLGDYNGKTQIWRFERDAKTRTLITQFGEAVWDFDVSPTTGELAIATKRGLFISDAWGANVRRVQLKGDNEPIEFTGAVQISWSPDGTRLLFAHRVIVVYSVANGSYIRLTSPLPDYDLYHPWYPAWSPNGKNVLVQMAVPDSDIWGMIVVQVETNKKVVSMSYPCGDVSWALDSQAIYFAQSFISEAYCGGPGLRRVDLANGQITELVPGYWNADLQFVHGAQESSDDNLYYFYDFAFPPAESFQGLTHLPVKMHRANKNDLSNPVLLRNDAYEISEVLWSPKFDLAVIVDTEAIGRPNNGNIFILTTDNKPAITLPMRGSNLRWGKN